MYCTGCASTWSEAILGVVDKLIKCIAKSVSDYDCTYFVDCADFLLMVCYVIIINIVVIVSYFVNFLLRSSSSRGVCVREAL